MVTDANRRRKVKLNTRKTQNIQMKNTDEYE